MNECAPRFATERDPNRKTYGPAVGAAAKALGMPLMPWQQLVADVGLEVDDDGKPVYREVIFSTPRQSGKGLALDTPIPTPDGWKSMGDLAVGDVLFDEKGARCGVTFVSDDRHLDCYRVAFSDGTDLIADGDHLWTVYDTWGHSNGSKGAWKTLSTREMVGKAKIGNRGKHESRYRLPEVGPLDCFEAELPFDPYVFGAWLGDGHSAAPKLTCGETDLNEMVAAVEGAGYVIKAMVRDKRTGAWDFAFEDPDHQPWARGTGALNALRTLGVWNNKHIPDAYLRSSFEQRLALLQGLMDTDGTVGINGDNRTNRSCEFSVCSEPLARGFLELVRSLGIRSNWKSGPAKINGRTVGTRYRLQFTTDLPVFRLARKAARHAEQGLIRKRARVIRDIEPVSTVTTRCIQVDSPNALFRAGEGMIPTHNTVMLLAWEVQRAIGWAQMLDAPQRIVYTAQTGMDARTKLLDDQFPLLERHRSQLAVARFTRANGYESVSFKNGSKIAIQASGEDAGHGKTLDLAVVDELFADNDDRRSQAMLPAMLTRPFAQMLVCSTMGTPKSLAWNAKVEKGRHAATSGKQSGIAYFEWSAERGADPEDPDVWRSCMPALGHTQPLEAIRHAYETMPRGEFERAFLNIPTMSDEQVIPAVSWDQVRSSTLEVDAQLFTFDCNPERTSAGICAIGSGPTVEVVDYRHGTGWLVERIVELALPHRLPVAVSASGPAGAFIPELERAGVKVVQVPARDEARAAGRFYDLVVTNGIQVRSDPDLDAAVGAAVKRDTGDAWAWARKSSMKDICLLVAASIGAFCVDTPQPAVFAY